MVHEIAERARELHADGSGAHDDEGELLAPARDVCLGGGGLEHIEHVPLECFRVGEPLHRHRVLADARNTEVVGDRAERDHEVVVR